MKKITLFGKEIPVISAKQAYPRRHKIANHPDGFEVVVREAVIAKMPYYEITVRFDSFKIRMHFSQIKTEKDIEDFFTREAADIKTRVNKLDALEHPIVIGAYYGYSQNYGGFLTVKVGKAIGYTEKGFLQLEVVYQRKAIHNEPLTGVGISNKIIAVKSGGLFRLVDYER